MIFNLILIKNSPSINPQSFQKCFNFKTEWNKIQVIRDYFRVLIVFFSLQINGQSIDQVIADQMSDGKLMFYDKSVEAELGSHMCITKEIQY